MGERICTCGESEKDHRHAVPSLSPFSGPAPQPGLCIFAPSCGCKGFREAEPHEDWTPGDAA